MDDAAAKTSVPAYKKGQLLAEAANVAEAVEQEMFHVVVTSAKGIAHALGAVVKLAWQEFHDLVEAGKARPASQAEVDKAFPPPVA